MRLNVCVSFLPFKTIFRASISAISPSSGAITSRPVYFAASSSMPVDTSGASGATQGHACFCMFEPMSARLASLCSRNGIVEVAIENAWFAATSIKSISSRVTSPGEVRTRACPF